MLSPDAGSKGSFKQLDILFMALLAGQILLCVILYFLAGNGENRSDASAMNWELSNTFVLVVMALLPGAYVLSRMIYLRRRAEGALLLGLQRKIEHYRATVVIQMAVLEGVNLIALVFFFLQGSLVLLLFFALGLIFFLQVRPSLERFSDDYEISVAEKQQLHTEA